MDPKRAFRLGIIGLLYSVGEEFRFMVFVIVVPCRLDLHYTTSAKVVTHPDQKGRRRKTTVRG